MAIYYGLDVGGTKIELAAFNEKLEKLHSERVLTPQTHYEDWLNTIENLVNNADVKFGEKGSVGLGLPGFVNRETGIAEITNIRVADGKAIIKDLSERLGVKYVQKTMRTVSLFPKLGTKVINLFQPYLA